MTIYLNDASYLLVLLGIKHQKIFWLLPRSMILVLWYYFTINIFTLLIFTHKTWVTSTNICCCCNNFCHRCGQLKFIVFLLMLEVAKTFAKSNWSGSAGERAATFRR